MGKKKKSRAGSLSDAINESSKGGDPMKGRDPFGRPIKPTPTPKPKKKKK